MPFVQAKCPECGGMLAVDDSKKAVNCQFCGEAFIVQEAINNYITNNITNNTTNHNYGDGAVVNVYEDTNKDFVIEAGVLKEYHGESTDVIVPEGVLEIAPNCFFNMCITNLHLPSSLCEMNDCLINMKNLKKLSIGKNNERYYINDGDLFRKYGEGIVEKHLFQINGHGTVSVEWFDKDKETFTIPDNVDCISQKVLNESNLKHLYYGDYDLLHFPCNVNIPIELTCNFPVPVIEHKYVNKKYSRKCELCGEYEELSWDRIRFKTKFDSDIFYLHFISNEIAIISCHGLKLFERTYSGIELDSINSQYIEKINNVSTLILYSLNSNHEKLPDASYFFCEGYNNLIRLFKNAKELIIEQDSFGNLESFLPYLDYRKFEKIEFGEDLSVKTIKAINTRIEDQKLNMKREEWKTLNKCQYCGGEFKYPLFGDIKCKKCGRKKDY